MNSTIRITIDNYSGIYVPKYNKYEWLNLDQYCNRDYDRPAIIWGNGDRAWYKNGKLHRNNDNPAIIRNNGDREWYQNGNLHRNNDNPAIIRVVNSCSNMANVIVILGQRLLGIMVTLQILMNMV
jgi:hypothetical protein